MLVIAVSGAGFGFEWHAARVHDADAQLMSAAHRRTPDEARSAHPTISPTTGSGVPTVVPSDKQYTYVAVPPSTVAESLRPPGTSMRTSGCGTSWASASSALGRYLAPRWGQIRICTRAGRYWIATTDATGSSLEGAIAVYRCGATSCVPPPIAGSTRGWQVNPAPNPGGVTLLAIPNPTTVIVDNGGYQIDFSLETMSYEPSG